MRILPGFLACPALNDRLSASRIVGLRFRRPIAERALPEFLLEAVTCIRRFLRSEASRKWQQAGLATALALGHALERWSVAIPGFSAALALLLAEPSDRNAAATELAIAATLRSPCATRAGSPWRDRPAHTGSRAEVRRQ